MNNPRKERRGTQRTEPPATSAEVREGVADGSSDPLSVIQRLADAVVKKSVVPFIGAGFSYGARHPSGWQSTPGRMQEQLQSWLDSELKERQYSTGCVTNLPSARDSESRSSDGKSQAGLGYEFRTLSQVLGQTCSPPPLSHLAEVGHVLCGAVAVCETLQIGDYAELHPEPQHRYLAYLIREGVISEVITTNYDCCVELALTQSFAEAKLDCNYAAVRNIEEYRQEAARCSHDGCLLLYKVNGCSRDYVEASKAFQVSKTTHNKLSWDEAAERIILTERQLQTFHEREWAKDLVRDRFRSRHLFFCGFGNDEPQVRHTVVTLVGEFNKGGVKANSPDEAMGLPNAPFLHSYEGPLSFNQLQMLVAFLDANSQPRRPESPCWQRITPVYRNVIAPRPPVSRLSASELMATLFGEVIMRLAVKALGDENQFVAWLQRCDVDWRMWRGFLRRCLEPSRQCDYRTWLLRHDDASLGFSIPLYHYLRVVLHPEKNAAAFHGWYVPLREQPVRLFLVVLWVAALSGQKNTPCETKFGLRFTLPSKKFVYLVAQESIQELEVNGGEEGKTRLLRKLVLPSIRRDVDAWGRWRQMRHGRLVPGRWIAVSSVEVIRRARSPGQVAHLVNDVFAEVKPRRPAARLTPYHMSKPCQK